MDMSVLETEQTVAIRGYELRLIRCTLNSEQSQSQELCVDSLNDSINHLLNLIQYGNYIQALTSQSSSHLVFQLTHLESPSLSDPGKLYSLLVDRAECFIAAAANDVVQKQRRNMLVTCIAVAAFLGFTQVNFIGPLEGVELPKCPLGLDGDDEGRDNWARNQLMSSGSDLVGKFSNLQYIVFAKMLLMRLKDLGSEMKSLPWWVLLVQQRVLDERCSSLSDLLHVYMGEALQMFGSRELVESYWQDDLHDGESSGMVSLIHLEAGIIEYVYGRLDSCRMHFKSAEMAAGLQLSVTGVLGFRTEHQAEPKAQRVLLTNTCTLNNVDENCLLSSTSSIQTCDSNKGEDDWNMNQHETSEATALRIPKLLENNDDSRIRSPSQSIENGGHVTPNLTAIQQSVILAFCLLIEKSSQRDELQLWDTAPYIEAIDSQNFSYFTIRCLSDLLRIRWESSRCRTKERALQMMDNLVKHIYEPSPAIADRIAFIYAVYMPSIPALQMEYGELLSDCGLKGEAAQKFVELELWYKLKDCYSFLGKKAAAVELIRKRLSEKPNDPILWCSLGDLTDNDACFEKALEVSNNRSSRAKRSMAQSAYKRGDYNKSILLWESALAVNSMDPDDWFKLGTAAVKAKDTGKALDAFTRVIQLDPENEEAWTYFASLHAMKRKGKEALIASKEALKFKRNSWPLWENYSHIAVEIGNISQALKGVQMVLDITNYKRVDSELLERITEEVEKRLLACNMPKTNQLCIVDSGAEYEMEVGGASVAGRSHETEKLLVLLGKVLQQIVRNGSGFGSDIWGLYAKWHRINGDLMMSSEALLKQVRSLQGSDTWKDQDRFKKFAKSSLDLCQVYVDMFSSASGSTKQLYTAELHLKNVIRQAQSCFSDTQEFRDLQACYDEVKMKLQSNSINA